MGGAQRILVDLVRAFQKEGHEITALFPGPGPIRDQMADVGIGDYYLPMLRSGPKSLGEKFRYLALARKSAGSIAADVAGKPFDFMYVNGPRAMLPAVLAARKLRLPVVAAVHLIHEGLDRVLLSMCFK